MNRIGVRTAPETASAGFSGRCYTDVSLPACWPGFSSGSPACCLPVKTEGTVPVQPLLFPSEHVTCLTPSREMKPSSVHWVEVGGERKASAISNIHYLIDLMLSHYCIITSQAWHYLTLTCLALLHNIPTLHNMQNSFRKLLAENHPNVIKHT